MTLPLRTEWRTASDIAPMATVETQVDFQRPYVPKDPAVPVSTHGQAHITRSGKVSFDLQADSEIYVGVFGFGPGEFADDRYGLKVRDEMLAANIGVEGGGMNGYDPAHGTWQQCLEAFRQKRIADTPTMRRWSGPLSVTDDDFFRVPQYIALLMAQPGWQGYAQGWRDWLRLECGIQPRFVNYRDEVEFFAGDPEDKSHPNLAILEPYGGIEAVIDSLRVASRCPVGPGLHGIDSTKPLGYSNWAKPRYADLLIQYHIPNLLPAPWTGVTLRHAAETMGYAAKHRDVNRPLSLNASLILRREMKQPDGSWMQTGFGTDPKTIAAQPWLCLAYGSTVIRCYALCSFDQRDRDVYPVGVEYQAAVKPGDPAYYALLSSATLVKENADLILGTEQPVPDAGPDFLCGHRLSSKGRIWWAVNLSEVARLVPESAVPFFDWTDQMMMDSKGIRYVSASASYVPANGVLVLTSRP
jgi:hypothetical protein